MGVASRPSWVEVDLAAIRGNVAAIAAEVAPARLCAVVKADGYGHGDVPVAEAAIEAGASWLAVAIVSEAARLREAGIEAPILLLSEPPPSQADQVVKWNITPTVYTRPFVEALAAAAPGPLAVHLKLDTGMHRVGASPAEAFEIARRVDASDRLLLEGLWTHLAVAEEDAEFSTRQLEALVRFRSALADQGIAPTLLHAANTAGALRFAAGRFDMVRVGIGIYGLRPARGLAEQVKLQPAMRVVSHVSALRKLPAGARPSYGRRRALPRAGVVATVPLGYADGITRSLSDRGAVLIRGRRYPFAGTVTMDSVVVDVGDGPVDIGDEVVLLGRQGEEEITADEWADLLDTINYEVVCDFGPRLPRRYLA